MADEQTNTQNIPASVKLIQRVTAALGFDPTKRPQPTATTFAEVIAEIAEERTEKAKEQAKSLALEAIAAAEAFGRKKAEFAALESKFVKEFGKVMKKVEALAAGQEPPPDEEEKTE